VLSTAADLQDAGPAEVSRELTELALDPLATTEDDTSRTPLSGAPQVPKHWLMLPRLKRPAETPPAAAAAGEVACGGRDSTARSPRRRRGDRVGGAELVVLRDDQLVGIDRAGRALRVAQHLVGAERLVERVVGQQAARQV